MTGSIADGFCENRRASLHLHGDGSFTRRAAFQGRIDAANFFY